MNNYTVYVHIFPNNKKYVGITRQSTIRRWNNGTGYKNSTIMYNAINKYKWHNIEHKILYTNLTKLEAEQMEIKLIKEWELNNPCFGYNIEKGGNATGKIGELQRKKISNTLKELYKDKRNHPMYGKKRIVASLYKSIIQYDMKNNVICKYNSLQSASKITKINMSCISECCHNKQHTAGGYIWKYEN